MQEVNAKKLFKKMCYIAVRDSNSLTLCKQWEILDVKLGTDLCFQDKILQQ